MLNMKKDFSTKNCITNAFRSNNGYIGNSLYKKYNNITFNTTENISKHINKYSTDITNNYKIYGLNNVKITCYNFDDDIALNKTLNAYTNDTFNITENNKLFNTTDNHYFTKKIHNTSNTMNNITKHINNNYESDIIRINTTTKDINYNYEHNDLIYHNKKIWNKLMFYSFYNDTYKLRKIEIISRSQQTDITNNIIETNNKTNNYIGNNYLNNNKIATIVLNPTPPLTDNYIWTPETTDNVVPGLDSLLIHLQSKYATINALQNAISNTNNTINGEIANIQTEIDSLGIINSNANKNLSYHIKHTDFMYQRSSTNHNYDNRRSFVIQNHYFTHQKKAHAYDLELQVQLLH